MQQRMRASHGMKSIGRQQTDGKSQESEDFQRVQRVLAKHFQHIRKQRDARSEKNQPGYIERIGVFAVVRQMAVNQVQAKKPNRNIHEENEPPVKVSDDQAAENRPQHGSNQGGDGDEAHSANQFGLGERSH